MEVVVMLVVVGAVLRREVVAVVLLEIVRVQMEGRGRSLCRLCT